jgi:hypothetical protein
MTILAATALAAPGALAQQVTITDFAHAGEGCPSGTVGQVYNPTTRTLTLTFDQYQAWIDPSGSDNPSAQCNLNFVLRGNRLLLFTVNRVQYLGYINKPSGITAELRRRYQFDLATPFSRVRTWASSSAVNGDFVEDDRFPGWSSCARQVTVGMDSRLALRGSSSQFSEMVMDREHVQTKVIWYFGWSPC